MQSSNLNTDATYESVGPSEHVYERKNDLSTTKMKKPSPIDAPPLPPPLPPPLKNHNFMRNSNRDSTDSLDDSIDFNQNDGEMVESDSGLEVVEEPTLRPSELVRGTSMSIISGMQILISYWFLKHLMLQKAP